MPKVHVTFEFESEEEMRNHFATESRAATPTAPTGETVAAAPVAIASHTVEPVEENGPTRADVDSDGMPYDAAVHSDPPVFTADGTWRAKRGCAEEAKKARDAFKARGGAVAAPTSLPTGLPGAAATQLPGAAALPASAPAPVTYEHIVEKITGMLSRGKIDASVLPAMYNDVGGPDAINISETARASLMNNLCEIEPELS